MSEEQHRPAVLLVGQGEPMQKALGEALRRHGVSVAACGTAELENAVRGYAPDLVVLIGDAAVRGGAGVIRRMAANRATDMLPIAVVSNEAVLKHEGPDFRSGAIAIVPRGAGADTVARRLAEVAREVPDRPGLARGVLTANNLNEVVSLVSSDHKTGILSIQSPRGVVDGMPVVIETESPNAHNMERILDRLREAISNVATFEYEFHEASGGRLSTLPGSVDTRETVPSTALAGTRIVLLDSDELRAEKLAHVLHDKGVQVAAADFSTAVLPRVREVDPQVIILDSSAVGGQGIELVRAVRRDRQLRWASMLVVRWEDFWPGAEAEPDLAQLASRVLPLIEQDADIKRRVAEEIDFDTRLELVGPGRMLRAMGSVSGVRHVAISGTKRSVEIDIADNSIVGAYATVRETTTEALQGIPALTALWGMNAGRVSVREQDLPSVANVMMPVDEALGVVARELEHPEGDGRALGYAHTVPPLAPGLEHQPTMPPTGLSDEELEEVRTIAPPRFRHLQAAAGQPGFADEEAPTDKVRAAVVGRIETERAEIAATSESQREALERQPQGLRRAPKDTQLGLAPAFEALPSNDAALAVKSETEEPTPVLEPLDAPPVTSAPPYADGELEPELAPMLEGPATILAPADSSSSPAWMLILLLLALVGGGGLVVWEYWLRGDSDAMATPGAEREPIAANPPITGPVDELEPHDEPEARQASRTAVIPSPDPGTVEGPDPEHSEGPTETVPAVVPPPAIPPNFSIPTHNLPRDPARASDVLVHRALPLIRNGELSRAEATLDRAWELDPKNPQAMAGYATLYVRTKDGVRAVKWAERAVRRRPRRTPYRILLGDALLLQGDTEGARRAWRKALAQDPGNRRARSRLAELTDANAN